MKTKLIALVALAVGAVAGWDQPLAEGDEFEVSPEVAEPLLTEGKAKLASAPPAGASAKSVKVRVLVGCELGQPDDVVEVTASAAKALEKDGLVDADKAAVAFAASLSQNQPQKRK